MEFNSIVGSQHTIEPIGYNQLRKKRRRDITYVVRSIQEQFMIHSLASDFQSPRIFIPCPLRIESSQSYVMDMVYNMSPLDPKEYKNHHELFEELIRFKNYMYIRGYFAAGFTILHRPNCNIFVLVDFSQFGTIDSNFVMFPKITYKYTILEAESQFGLIGRDIITESFKKKHEEAKSPVEHCILELPELKIDILDEEDSIVCSRTVSCHDWNKIDPFIT